MSELTNYLRDLAAECRLRGTAAKHAQIGKTDPEARGIEFGRSFAFGEVLSIIMQDMEAYGVSMSELGLDGFDPHRDLGAP